MQTWTLIYNNLYYLTYIVQMLYKIIKIKLLGSKKLCKYTNLELSNIE